MQVQRHCPLGLATRAGNWATALATPEQVALAMQVAAMVVAVDGAAPAADVRPFINLFGVSS